MLFSAKLCDVKNYPGLVDEAEGHRYDLCEVDRGVNKTEHLTNRSSSLGRASRPWPRMAGNDAPRLMTLKVVDLVMSFSGFIASIEA